MLITIARTALTFWITFKELDSYRQPPPSFPRIPASHFTLPTPVGSSPRTRQRTHHPLFGLTLHLLHRFQTHLHGLPQLPSLFSDLNPVLHLSLRHSKMHKTTRRWRALARPLARVLSDSNERRETAPTTSFQVLEMRSEKKRRLIVKGQSQLRTSSMKSSLDICMSALTFSSFLRLNLSLISFLFGRWFHVFYDVHSARSGKGGSVQARSLVQANSSVQTVASRTQISPARRVPGQQQQRPRPPITIDTAQTQARPSLGSRRMSGMGTMQQTSEVPGRTVVNRATPFQQPASVSHSQPPPLSRRNSQQLYVQQQQESQARQQTLQERQRLQQVQMEQIQMQKQMMDKLQQEAQQITARQKSLSGESTLRFVSHSMP